MSIAAAAGGCEGGGEVTPRRAGAAAAGAMVAVTAERPGLRLMRIVGSQYDATVAVEAWVAKAEAKVKVRKARTCSLLDDAHGLDGMGARELFFVNARRRA